MALPDTLRRRLTLPAFAAPMFLVSGPELAIACCQAGIIGSLTRNHCRDIAELEAQLGEAQAASTRRTGSVANLPAVPYTSPSQTLVVWRRGRH